MREKIVLAFSGGVDSTISAIKLSHTGYDVHAVYFNFWKWKDVVDRRKEIENAAREIQQITDIQFSVIEAQERMSEVVIADFTNQLSLGNTPNPCIRCNPLIKFKLLLDFANLHSIQKIATGHYARIEKGAEGKFILRKAKDLSKDQSYMLCCLNQEILARTVFPLGDAAKSEIKQYAAELGLAVSKQPESQDLCFLNGNTYHDFVKEFSPEILVPGDIVNTKDEILGQHEGLALYTIGQRKGIRIASREPYYVIEKDVLNNRLVVGYLEELGRDELLVEQVNWISGKEMDKLECDVKIRYHSRPYKGFVYKISNKDYTVKFKEKLRDITPGQYAVFYNTDEVLGGGMIVKVN